MYSDRTRFIIILLLIFFALFLGSNPIALIVFVLGFQSDSKNLLDDFFPDIIFSKFSYRDFILYSKDYKFGCF